LSLFANQLDESVQLYSVCMSVPQPVTELLRAWRGGDENALEVLTASVYDELRRLAGARMRSERAGHTLQPTELVNEAFLRLMTSDVEWADRAHFFAIAARTMRRVLVDHARTKGRLRRGSGAAKVTLDERLLPAVSPTLDVVILDQALAELEALDAEQARMVELYHFAGLTLDEIAAVSECSAPTVHRRLKSAQAWLAHRLGDHTTHADHA
jgi:RNA polymerase sigma factor (TIGR02999 family)